MALMVSVSGIRGLVGDTLTPAVALQFAQAYGTLLNGGRVALGRDSRPSGEMYTAAVTAGLNAAGCAVTDLGIVMTPTIGHAICDGGYDGGIMITASHNPGQWNGLKFLNNQGLAPDPETVRRIAEIRDSGSYANIRADFPPITKDPDAGKRHREAVLNVVEADLSPMKGKRVVLDSINGAGCVDTPEMLAAMGIEVVHLNGKPTGVFAHMPEPIVENLTQVCDSVKKAGAMIGFVQDPDADRLAIIDGEGNFIGEEYTLVLAVESVLRRRKGDVAANLSTSRMIDDVASRFGVKVHRTPVGEAHVARALLEKKGAVGGEGNGGVIDPRICPVRDSLSAISLVLQLMAETGKSVNELISGYPKYYGIKQKVECSSKDRIAEAIEATATAFSGERMNRSDGVRIDFEEGWVHLRGSNTEPIVRIIGEAADAASAQLLVKRVRDAARI